MEIINLIQKVFSPYELMISFKEFIKIIPIKDIIMVGLGATATHWATIKHDERRDKIKQTKDLISASHLTCFTLALQISELENLKLNIKDRKKAFIKLKEILDDRSIDRRNTLVQITQDFPLQKDLTINLKNLNTVIFISLPHVKAAPAMLQNIFIAKEKYLKVLETLERYHKAKLEIYNSELSKHPHNFEMLLLQFWENNVPQWEAIVDDAQDWIESTFNQFKEFMLNEASIQINISLEEVYQANKNHFLYTKSDSP